MACLGADERGAAASAGGRGISWLRAQLAGRGRPVVLYGASAGAEAVLLLASYLPHLADAAAADSPTAVVTPGNGAEPSPAWTFGGKPLVPLMNIPVTRIRLPHPSVGNAKRV